MIELEKIGIIHTPFENDEDIPFQAYKSKEEGKIEVFEEYEESLKDIEGFSHVIVLYKFHNPIEESVKEKYHLKSEGLLVKPYLDDKFHGKFSTRSPNRPNPIGLSILKLLKREENILHVEGVDMLNETPLLDLKPYIPKFDQRDNVEIGWCEESFKSEDP